MDFYWDYRIQYNGKVHSVNSNSIRNALRKLMFRLHPAKDPYARSNNVIRADKIFEAQNFKVVGQSIDKSHYVYPIQEALSK